MRSWIVLLMFLTCPLEQKSCLSVTSRALHWASQQLIVSWEGFCVAVKALLLDMVHSTLQVHVCMQGRSSKTSSLGKVSILVGYFGAPLMQFSDRLNSARNEGATPLELVKSPSTLSSLRWQSCDKGKLQEKQVPLGMNPVYKQGRIAGQMSCKTEANYILTFSLWVFPWCLIDFPVNSLTDLPTGSAAMKGEECWLSAQFGGGIFKVLY